MSEGPEQPPPVIRPPRRIPSTAAATLRIGKRIRRELVFEKTANDLFDVNDRIDRHKLVPTLAADSSHGLRALFRRHRSSSEQINTPSGYIHQHMRYLFRDVFRQVPEVQLAFAFNRAIKLDWISEHPSKIRGTVLGLVKPLRAAFRYDVD